MSKVDYCNVVLAGLPQRELDRLQSVVNAAARLSAEARKYDHVTSLLMDLHWLRVPERVKFKLCVLMHRCLTGAAPRQWRRYSLARGIGGDGHGSRAACHGSLLESEKK